jgi:type II secretory pathway pseudopilin PulG
LITLGIIGVVAAMTIPTLMTKVKEKQTVTKVKKAYSTLANAYKLMENDDEVPLSGCIEGGNAKVCLTTLSKYIKSAKIVECGSGDSEWFDEKNVPTVSWMSITANNTQILQTMDGMIFYFVCYPLSEIIVDVNGQAGPNAGGKDAFAFYYNQYDNNGKKQLTYKLRPASGICTKTNYGDWCTAQLLQTGNMDYLTKTAKELGFTDPNDSSSSFIGNSLDDSSTSFICNMTSSNSFISNY